MVETSAKILLADDQIDALDLLNLVLSNQGYITESTLDPRQVVKLAEKITPDLILLDVMMPQMDGFQVCSFLKNNQNTKDIPVIFLTALESTEEKVKGFNTGCVDYITKPFDLEEIIVRVQHQLEIKNLQEQLKEKNYLLERELKIRVALEHKLRIANKKLKNIATIDGLTGIANRRKFDLQIKQEWLRASREQTPLSLILVDVDHFKSYNDSHGHQAGDNCLQLIAQGISRAVNRPADLVARYGGEEFAVVLPNTHLAGANHVANRIRASINYSRIPHKSSSVSKYVTVSQGISATIPNADHTFESLICIADTALYDAKKDGRDRFASYSL